MAALSIQLPFPVFTDADGQPVDGGYVWIGQANKDPRLHPVNVYFDKNLLIPAGQPLRTVGGYIVHDGSPAQLFIDGTDYSILVQNRKGINIYSFPSGTGVAPDSSAITYLPAGAGAVARTVQDKLREFVSVKDFGAVGDGVTDDSADFAAAKAAAGAYGYYTPSGNYDLGAADPDFNLNGLGKVTANGVTTGGTQLTYNPARESAFFNPDTYQREVQGVNYPPPRGDSYITSSYNVVFAPGSKLNDLTKTIRYNVVFGDLCGSTPGTWGYNNVFGSNAMAYAYNVSRNTIVGSESFVWAGAPNQQWLITYQHDWWRRPPDNPYIPGEVGWDASGLETKFPGIGARLAAFTAYATNEMETAYNSTLGRDAGNHVVKGIRNVYVGYRSGGQNFVGSYNTAVGSFAMEQAVFADYITAVGDQAGRDCLDSVNATFLGYAAGRTVQDASEAVIIGDRAADEVLSATAAVIIGPLAGASHPTNLNDKLVIANARSTTRDPLISGRFSDEVAGVAVQPEALRAKWHVQASSSGSTLEPVAGILVEGAGQASLTLETGSSGFPAVRFADTDSNTVGSIEYSHGSDTMTFSTNGAARLRIESDGILRPWTDNTISLGRSAFRWSQVFAANATINTSDAREKQQIRDLSEAERAVALKIKKLIRAFKWNDSVAKKGDKARIHFGVIAQDVKAAFESEGLNADDYGLFCYDEWDDEFEHEVDGEGNMTGSVRQTVTSGNRYGIRYEELLAFIIAAL